MQCLRQNLEYNGAGQDTGTIMPNLGHDVGLHEAEPRRVRARLAWREI